MSSKLGSTEGIHAVVFEGGERPFSWPESLILQVRIEASKELIEMLLSTRETNYVTLISEYNELIDYVKSHSSYENKLFLVNTKEDSDMERFNYGKVLQKIIAENAIDKILVCGGGSTPLIKQEEITSICRRLLASDKEPLLYANNPQSGDIVAFSPASAIMEMDPPSSDNALVMGLRYEVGLPFYLIPFSTGILFDLDTPAELFLLLEDNKLGKRMKNFINALDKSQKEIIQDGLERFLELKKVMSKNYEDIVLVGRISGSIMTHINENIKCRLRVFSEERGMKAMGRVEELKVRSLLGYFIEKASIDDFFTYLESLGKGCIIDSRVIFSHFGLGWSTADRFCSDLFLPAEIEDEFVRNFTRRAEESSIPILLGGHSLVSGGLYATVEQIVGKTNK